MYTSQEKKYWAKKIMCLFACLFWLGGLAQCGDEKALSKDVRTKNIPDSPIVVNAKLVLYPGTERERTISPPWFLWGVLVNNLSTNDLVLVTYELDIRGSGAGSTKKTSIDPNVTCSDDSVSRPIIAYIPAGQSYSDLVATSGEKCDATAIVTTSVEQFYVDALPKNPVGDFSYTVEVKGVGWFVDEENIPIERYESYGLIITE